MKRFHRMIVVLLVCLLLPSVGVTADTGSPSAADGMLPVLHLRLGDKELERNATSAIALAAGLPDDEMIVALIQFKGPIEVAWREGLEQLGAEIVDYIPDYAYKVKLPAGMLGAASDLDQVVWAGPYPQQALVAARLAGASDTARIEPADYRLELGRPVTIDDREIVSALGGQLLGWQANTLTVRADQGQLAALQQVLDVTWLGALSIPRLANDVATTEIGADQVWTDVGLHGEGQLIVVADTGIDSGVDYYQIDGDMHQDIDNRVDRISSWPIDPTWHGYVDNPYDNDGAADVDTGHGTHVTGSVAGDGALSSGQYKGMAYKAHVAVQALEQYIDVTSSYESIDFYDGYWMLGIPSDLTALYAEAYGWGGRIHTNSWNYYGDDYAPECRQTDAFVWEHPDMTILFSIGNDGSDENGDGIVDYGSIAYPATAKNIITVGGTENLRPTMVTTYPYQTYGQGNYNGTFPANPLRDDSMADAGIDGMMAISSRGPAEDGRIKPDVVAPGTWIASMRSSRAMNPFEFWGVAPADGYAYMGGTSMSTPIVAGAAALVRQAYFERGHQPSAALVKAALIQTATDIPGQYVAPYNEAGPIPNNDEGWGAVNVALAVKPERLMIDETTDLSTGETATYVLSSRGIALPARFTLVWSDYPASLDASKQLVNDLDLQVEAPDGTTYKGNVFSGGWSVEGGEADRLNNVECVYLPTSQEGAYTITMRGANVPISSQFYALRVILPEPADEHLCLPLLFRKRRIVEPTPTSTATQAPSATPSAPVTLAPSPTPTATATLQPGEIHDDFGQRTHWPTINTADLVAGYAGETYRLQVLPDASPRGVLADYESSDDMLLEVDVWAGADHSQAFGLAFNADGAGNYQAFIISPSGVCAVVDQDGYDVLGSGWISSTDILDGQAVNRVGVRRQGERVEFIINNVVQFASEEGILSGQTGLGLVAVGYQEPMSDARFDDLHMLPLAQGAGFPASSRIAVVGDGARCPLPPLAD